MKEIKTKSTTKDVKALDKASGMSRKMKNAYIHTKNQTEQHWHNDDGNYVDNAGNSIEDFAGAAARKTGIMLENNVVQKTKDTISQLPERNIAPGKVKEAIKQNAPTTGAKHVPGQSSFKYNYYSGKKGRTLKQSAFGDKAAKKAAVRKAKTALKSIKTAEQSVKAGTKAIRVVKPVTGALQVVQKTPLTAKNTAVVSAQTAVKTLVVAIKAIVAGVQDIAVLLAACGGVALAVILVICLAGLLLGSAYGIFFSNESYTNTRIMSEVVVQINEEFTAEFHLIRDENPHDTLELSVNGSSVNETDFIISNWREILVVYAVKVVSDSENGMNAAVLDDTKEKILRNVFWDMNIIDYWVEVIEHHSTATATDEDGNTTEVTVTTTETILYIDVTSKAHNDMLAEYGFNKEQEKMLDELMQDEYQDLFMQLTGS